MIYNISYYNKQVYSTINDRRVSVIDRCTLKDDVVGAVSGKLKGFTTYFIS